jgi:hypothetical protein
MLFFLALAVAALDTADRDVDNPRRLSTNSLQKAHLITSQPFFSS